jgi:hypothetical protein
VNETYAFYVTGVTVAIYVTGVTVAIYVTYGIIVLLEEGQGLE